MIGKWGIAAVVVSVAMAMGAVHFFGLAALVITLPVSFCLGWIGGELDQ